MLNFSIIVACTQNGLIGINGKIPWYLPDDLIHFKKITTNTTHLDEKNIVIMGRKTWESLPELIKPLKNRINIIISTQLKLDNTDVYVKSSLQNAFEFIKNSLQNKYATIFIIGGEQLYKQAISEYYSSCEKVYITYVILSQEDKIIDYTNAVYFPINQINEKFVVIEKSYENNYNNINYYYHIYNNKNAVLH
jgi:dihydrofolate reductase